MDTAVRRLTRSRRDRVFAGICGGLALYMGLDPVLVRVLYVALTLLSWGTGILIYLLAWIIIPADAEDAPAATVPKDESSKRDARRIFGVLLVIVGLLALASTTLPWFNLFHSLRLAGPIVLMVIGLVMLMWRRESTVATPDSTHTYGAEEGVAPRGAASAPPYSEPRRLTRSEHGRKMAGVCAGLGEYFNVDPTIVRLLFIAGIFAGGAGVILYLIMWIVVPLRREMPVTRVGA
jgi:phage shock protein C